VAAFPTYLSALHSHTSDMVSRQAILENLIDEERGAENHPELWLQFADAVGAKREVVLNSEIKSETQNLINEFKGICSTGTVSEGLSALYAYESQIPGVSATKIEGLTKFYGINSESGLKYFKVHQEADVKHSADERAMLKSHLQSDGEGQSVAVAERVTKALWGVLSGVCERHHIACN
jgi:pyrroloquinoline-quinone synthase